MPSYSLLAEGNATAANVTVLLWLLIAVAVVAVLTKFIRVPYTIALVLAGLGIALTPGVPAVIVTPDLIVLVFLPALLFESAYNLSFDQLRRVFRFITGLAVVGVFCTAALVAALLVWLGGLPWPTAAVFGAIVAATDPISVVAAFRKLGAPHRLTILIESESLFNDGSALVLFNLLVAIVVAGQFSFWGSVTTFFYVSGGGLLIGIATGYLALGLLSQLNDYLTETLVTLIVAYGTFLLAEELGFSPALAVVAAGLLVGNYAQEKVMSPTSRITVGLSWELISFLANSLIFLLVGLEVRAVNFVGDWWGIALLAIGATLLARSLVILAFSGVTRLLSPASAIPFSWQLMLIWGGLRGALSLALVLSLPLTLAGGAVFPDRDKLLVMTFGVILFTLLVQGLTIRPLLKRLKLNSDATEQLQQYETLRGELLIARAARQELETLSERNLVNSETAQTLLEEYQQKETAALAHIRELQMSNELLKEESQRAWRRRLLQQEKSTARDLHRQGIINEEVMRGLWASVDARLTLLEQPGDGQAVLPALRILTEKSFAAEDEDDKADADGIEE